MCISLSLHDKLFKLLPIEYTCMQQNDVVMMKGKRDENEKPNEISSDE
jgi:hypothetical protein